MEFDDFPTKLWTKEISAEVEGVASFAQLIKYVLTKFHLLCRDHQPLTTNHERSFFVSYVVPNLLVLSKTYDIVSFTWCGFELEAIKSMSMFDHKSKVIEDPSSIHGPIRKTQDFKYYGSSDSGIIKVRMAR